jgi:hypothetical protein
VGEQSESPTEEPDQRPSWLQRGATETRFHGVHSTPHMTLHPPCDRAPRRRRVLGAESLGRARSRRAHRSDDGDNRREGRHAHLAPTPALWAAVDRLAVLLDEVLPDPLQAQAGVELLGDRRPIDASGKARAGRRAGERLGRFWVAAGERFGRICIRPELDIRGFRWRGRVRAGERFGRI